MNPTHVISTELLQSNSPLDNPDFVQAFLCIAANPNDPELAWYFKLEEVMMHLEKEHALDYVRQLRLDPETADKIEQRYFGPEYKLEDLGKNCAPGTLGYVYYHHMIENGIVPYDYKAYESIDDLNYIKLRKMQTHDIWHVVAGYKTDLFGELALQGFYQGQGPTIFQTLLMNALVLHFATVKTKYLNLALDALFEGWQRGRKAHPLWAVPWEEMWHRPLAEIQQELNLTPPQVLTSI